MEEPAVCFYPVWSALLPPIVQIKICYRHSHSLLFCVKAYASASKVRCYLMEDCCAAVLQCLLRNGAWKCNVYSVAVEYVIPAVVRRVRIWSSNVRTTYVHGSQNNND